MDFDTEHFITEIRKRPPIWNTKSPEYCDKLSRLRAWDELVAIYGADLPQEKQRQLGVILQKKWRNIRDCFVKAHKAKETNTGCAAKRKVPYTFYDNLLFMKETITFHATGNTEASEDMSDDTQNEEKIPLRTIRAKRKKKISAIQNEDDSNSSSTPQRSKKSKATVNEDPLSVPSNSWAPQMNMPKEGDELFGRELIDALNRSIERNNVEQDEDRLFFLSLVNEFKKIPDDMRMQTKLDIMKAIRDAQFALYHK